MKSGVYTITNTINGHRYVGSAVNIKGRWRSHKSELIRGTHRNGHLQNAWNKYGESAFEFDVLLYCEPEMLLDYEQEAIDQKSEYNIALVAGSSLGVTHTAETRANMSAAQSGRSAEWCAKISAAKTGHKQTAEAIAKRSAGMIGHEVSDETRAKISATNKGHEGWMKGKKHTAEAKAKISKARTGMKFSDEHVANISASLMGNQRALGHKHTDESKAKISAAGMGNTNAAGNKGRPWSPARRAAHEARRIQETT